jgi:hypothetical protein
MRGVLLATCAVFALGWCACAEADATAQVGGERSAPVPWVPSESWPGGEQYDPRLDRRVKFWGAGMPLKDVFAGVRGQTGVEIGFWPAGDDNERICVNLYLNPEKPPTLRELMVQLSWVMDCGFGLTREEGDPKYCLLSTSIRYAAERRLRGETRALFDRIRERQHGREDQTSAKVAAKLAELTDALALPREEAIRRYRGVDDLLLLALLEPGRRRVADFILGLPREDLGRFLDEGELRFEWEDLSPEQRNTLRQHFRADASWAMKQEYGYVCADPSFGWNPSAEIPFTVVLTGARHGFFVIRGEFWSDEDQDEAAPVFTGQHLRLVSAVERPEETMALLQALDEEPDSSKLDAMYDEARVASQAKRRQWLEQQHREWVQSQLSRRSIASSEVRNVLTMFRFPGSRDGCYPLWAVQEAVAAGTGLHVVSDCFSQPSRSIVVFLELLDADEAVDMTGLLALKLWSLSAAEEAKLPRPGINDAEAGWEWGDAGSFLRFRHLARDLWRAAFLPEPILERIDAWLGPYTESAEGRGTAVEVKVDLEHACKLVAALDGWQAQHGGKSTYAEPNNEHNARLHALREKVLGEIGRNEPVFRFLATLGDDQWKLLRGRGLRWGEDLSPDQQEMGLGSYFLPFGQKMHEMVLRLEEGGPAYEYGREERPEVPETYVLALTLPTGPPSHGPREYTSLETGELVAIHRIFLPRKVRVAFPQREVGEQQPGTASEIEKETRSLYPAGASMFGASPRIGSNRGNGRGPQ